MSFHKITPVKKAEKRASKKHCKKWDWKKPSQRRPVGHQG